MVGKIKHVRQKLHQEAVKPDRANSLTHPPSLPQTLEKAPKPVLDPHKTTSPLLESKRNDGSKDNKQVWVWKINFYREVVQRTRTLWLETHQEKLYLKCRTRVHSKIMQFHFVSLIGSCTHPVKHKLRCFTYRRGLLVCAPLEWHNTRLSFG